MSLFIFIDAFILNVSKNILRTFSSDASIIGRSTCIDKQKKKIKREENTRVKWSTVDFCIALFFEKCMNNFFPFHDGGSTVFYFYVDDQPLIKNRRSRRCFAPSPPVRRQCNCAMQLWCTRSLWCTREKERKSWDCLVHRCLFIWYNNEFRIQIFIPISEYVSRPWLASRVILMTANNFSAPHNNARSNGFCVIKTHDVETRRWRR